jgi:short-subunit dehydrogenase
MLHTKCLVSTPCQTRITMLVSNSGTRVEGHVAKHSSAQTLAALCLNLTALA